MAEMHTLRDDSTVFPWNLSAFLRRSARSKILSGFI